MVRIVRIVVALGLGLTACSERDSLFTDQKEQREQLAESHAEERRELAQEQATRAQEQAQERRELEVQQATQRKQAETEAQQQLQSATDDLREIRARLRREIQEVNQTMSLACRGIPKEQVDACPIARESVASVTDSDRGIVVHVRVPPAPSEAFAQLERAVTCYQARVERRAALSAVAPDTAAPSQQPAPERACLLDAPGLSIDVVRVDEGAAVQLWSDEPGTAATLRERAAAWTASLTTPPRRSDLRDGMHADAPARVYYASRTGE